jgi:heptosyltransferase II
VTGKTIIYLPNWIGDMVMATPFLLSVRQWAKGEMWAAGKPSAMQLFNGLDLFDRFLPYDGRSMAGFFDLVANLRKGRFDRGFILPHSFRSALLFFLGTVRERIGYGRNSRGMILTRVIEEGPAGLEPTVEHYLRILDAERIPRVTDSPRLVVTEDEDRRFDERFSDVGRGHIVFIIGAQYGPSKCWPEAHFSRLADLLVEHYGVTVYLLPGKGEEEIARRIRDRARHSGSIGIKDMNVREMKVCLSRAALVVSNDTGPRHISAALSVPTVVILGPMDDQYTVYPSGVTRRVINDVPCRPCNRKECDRDHQCLKGIAPEYVLEKAEEVFGVRPVGTH